MSDTTPRSGLPLLAAAQAQKHVTHNEALLELDALLHARLITRTLSAPPAAPADGDTYLVKAGATTGWTGQDGKIAYAFAGAWRFYTPFAGLTVRVADEGKAIVFDGAQWSDVSTASAPPQTAPTAQTLPLLGINTTADATNKLAVKSAAVLFDNAGNGAQLKLNKHATADTASLLYQTNYSGRAEMGLTGDDNFHVKVSPDGASWKSALVIDRSTGAVDFGAVSPADGDVLQRRSGVWSNRAPADLAADLQSRFTQILSSNAAGDSSGRAGDFRNTKAGFTGSVLFVAGSNAVAGGYSLMQGYDLASGTTTLLIGGNGSVVNANNSYGAISDLRLKQDIADAASQWSDIKALKLRRYRLKSDVARDPDAPSHLGLVAQEAAEVSPHLVTTGPVDDLADAQGIKYSVLYLKALGALQEAMARIEALEARAGIR
ncbi:MAG TPA: DUF2793 domain-containing protein [Rhizomicrobium sp.]|nr:DUF2793 domain-containing protein [Rhizomicrobium sp.]